MLCGNRMVFSGAKAGLCAEELLSAGKKAMVAGDLGEDLYDILVSD